MYTNIHIFAVFLVPGTEREGGIKTKNSGKILHRIFVLLFFFCLSIAVSFLCFYGHINYVVKTPKRNVMLLKTLSPESQMLS
jgi:hypothetical protein